MPTAASEAVVAPPPRSEPRRPEGTRFPPALIDQARALLDRLGQLRGSPPKGDIDMFLLSRAQARSYYAGPEGPSNDRRRDVKQDVYELLGLVPPRVDVAQQSLDFLVSQITGFYHEELDAFYLLDDLGGLDSPQSRMTVVHELIHALQDQYYDFGAISRQRGDDWDAYRTLLSVMEGDALATEIAYFGYTTHRRPACFTIPARARTDIAFVVEREQNTLYEDGLCFVQAVTPRLPNGIAGVWENLPLTTEQILHPDKYLAGEGAQPVTLTPLEHVFTGGWFLVERHNFGEFGLQNLLLLGLADRLQAQRAAAGWGGDAWALYSRGEALLLQAVVVWDSAGEAQEFWSAFVASLDNRTPLEMTWYGPNAIGIEIDSRHWRAALAGDRVTFLVATDAETVALAATHMGLP